MALKHHKRSFQVRLPDIVALLLLSIAIIQAVLWWRENASQSWLQTGGRVLACDLENAHYNAPATSTKVRVDFEYMVLGTSYRGRWEGFWPEANSPNAMPPNRLNQLQQKGFPLLVLYNVRHPNEHILHFVSGSAGRISSWVFALTLILACYYIVGVYPSWKKAHAGRR